MMRRWITEGEMECLLEELLRVPRMFSGFVFSEVKHEAPLRKEKMRKVLQKYMKPDILFIDDDTGLELVEGIVAEIKKVLSMHIGSDLATQKLYFKSNISEEDLKKSLNEGVVLGMHRVMVIVPPDYQPDNEQETEEKGDMGSNDKVAKKMSLSEMEKLVSEMRPSGKINDIYAIRLFLLGIIEKLKSYIEEDGKNI